MTPKHTTINTVTLTCSTCGSAQFTKLAPNEYRCNHCHALTLVEDDVAQRLEKILRGMQQPSPAPQVKPAVLAAIGLTVAAVIAIPLVASLLSSGPFAGAATPGATAADRCLAGQADRRARGAAARTQAARHDDAQRDRQEDRRAARDGHLLPGRIDAVVVLGVAVGA